MPLHLHTHVPLKRNTDHVNVVCISNVYYRSLNNIIQYSHLAINYIVKRPTLVLIDSGSIVQKQKTNILISRTVFITVHRRVSYIGLLVRLD